MWLKDMLSLDLSSLDLSSLDLSSLYVVSIFVVVGFVQLIAELHSKSSNLIVKLHRSFIYIDLDRIYFSCNLSSSTCDTISLVYVDFLAFLPNKYIFLSNHPYFWSSNVVSFQHFLLHAKMMSRFFNSILEPQTYQIIIK